MHTPIQLRLISWNLHGVPFTTVRRERFRRVAARLLDEQPDVVLLQEVWLRRDASRLIRDLAADYEPVPSPGGGFPVRRSGLLGFVRRASGWVVGDARFHEFATAAPTWKFWEGDGLGRKGVQQIELEHGATHVVLLNTHLQADYPWHDYEPIRRPQLQQLRELTARLDRQWPVISGGDFNTSPRASLYAELVDVWNDLTAGRREQSGRGTHLDANGIEGDWIDYLLARRQDAWDVNAEDLRLIENTGPDTPYSDHHGLQATLRLHCRDAARIVK